MKMIDAAHMTEAEFLEECFRKQYTYQDYRTNVELTSFGIMSQRLFNGHMMIFNEKKHFATL